MAAAGMSFRQILASLTTAPAERFGDSKRLGRIAPGFQADVVAFKDTLNAVQYVIQRGQKTYFTPSRNS